MVQKPGRARFRARHFLLLSALFVAGICFANSSTLAQGYTCFPTCDSTDARFLSIAGAGINTLSGQDIYLTVVSPASATSLEIGIFDGETGGKFDIGTVPLEFTLFADPSADGTGTLQVGQWSGATMPDFAWYSVSIANTGAALTPSGNYYYVLRVSTTNPGITHWSNFKLRTDGVIFLRPGQAFSLSAPLPNLASAQVVYSNYPTLTPTTYDGNWTFYIDVPIPLNEFYIWNGDMDFGDWQCTNVDEDDPDSPNGVPVWAPGTSVVDEGVARSAIICTNGDTATANPTDDSPTPVLRRTPNIFMELIDPNGFSYVDGNPSGNLEWEQFRVSTAPFDRSQMDYHADSLPPGIYTFNIFGMDMQNLNAMRFGPGPVQITPYLMGVDTAGNPVKPPPPVLPDTATVAGTLFYDGNNDGVLNNNELGIPGIALFLYVDYNGDDTTDATYNTVTDQDGRYVFSRLRNSRCTIVVDSNAINVNAVPTGDPDGMATPHRAVVTINAQNQAITGNFGYRQVLMADIVGQDTVMGNTATSYSSQVNEPEVTYTWSISGSGTIVGSTHGPTVSVQTGAFGTFTLTLTVSKNGSTISVSKEVVVAGIDFAIFGYNKVNLEGRCGNDTTRGIINGNIGVNYPVTGCYPLPNLLIGNGCNGGGYVGDGTRVMGDYVDLGPTVSVWDLYANRTTGSTNSATKRNSGPTAFTAPIIAPANLPRIPNFTYNSTNVCVYSNQTRTLAPGRYGTITINCGGVLNLGNGIYNIKSIRTATNVCINTQPGTKVRIARDLLICSNSYVGPENGALFIVRSDGVCNGDPSVAFGHGTEFHGQVLAPNGTIDLGEDNDLIGRFWAKRVNGDCNTNVTYWGPVANLTNGNNDGFQKKLLSQAIAGAANNAMMKQSYPNPFNSNTTVTLAMNEETMVTLRVVDASGNDVRMLMEGQLAGKGETKVVWDGRDNLGAELPSGTYFFYLKVGERVEAQPVVLTR